MQSPQHQPFSSSFSSEPLARSPLRTIQDNFNFMYQTPPPPPRPACRTCEVFGPSDLYSEDLLLPTFRSFDENDEENNGNDFDMEEQESPRDARHIILLNPRATPFKIPATFSSKSPFRSSLSICSSPSEPDLVESFDLSEDEKEELLMLKAVPQPLSLKPRSSASSKCPAFPHDD